MGYYLIFCSYLTFYCILHSILADPFVLRDIYYKWWYRGFYVFQSLFLLIPAIYFYSKLPSEEFFHPGFAVKIFLGAVFAFALIFGIYTAKFYNNASFLGLEQIRQYLYKGTKEYDLHRELSMDGTLKYIRHPYYFSGLLLLWSRPLYTKDLVLNVVFTLYFIIGSINEERKLKNIFGKEYVDYCRNVPMLIPKFLNPYYIFRKLFKNNG